MTEPNVGDDFDYVKSIADGARAFGMVDFSMFPHLDHKDLPGHSMANAEGCAANLPVTGYAVDDQTAIKVVDGAVDVISQGHWKLFAP